MKRITSFLNKRDIRTTITMLLGTTIFTTSLIWIVAMGGFYTSGVTGIAQIISFALEKAGITLSMSYFVLIINIPLFLIGWKSISKRFAIFSALAVLYQSILILILEALVKEGFQSFLALKDDRLTLALLGGFLGGLGSGIVLRGGASGGGLEIISQLATFKKGASFTKFFFIVDFFIILTGSILGADIAIAAYTLIRLITSLIVVDRIYTIYHFTKISVVTTKKDELRKALISNFVHGVTIYEALGGYDDQKRYVFDTIILAYEIDKYRNIILNIDPKAFISYTSVKRVDGLYFRRAIT